jgi:hypothetical protein
MDFLPGFGLTDAEVWVHESYTQVLLVLYF